MDNQSHEPIGTIETHPSGEANNSSPQDKKVPVVEMFGPTIEGEGALIGTQTFFIRFGLCDYKCKKCDSNHAVDPKLVKANAEWITPIGIGEAFLRFRASSKHEHINTVTFSGGNPAIHDLTKLVKFLHDNGIRVLVETQGTKAPEWLYNVDHIVVSPKAPGMGEKFEDDVFMAFMQKYAGAGVPMSVKVVVFSALDIQYAADIAQFCKENLEGYTSFNTERDFFLSLGNPYPPIFKLFADGVVKQYDDPQLVDPEKKEMPNKNALVETLLSSYNILSAEVMRDPRISFARFLPQLHVLVYGNETGR